LEKWSLLTTWVKNYLLSNNGNNGRMHQRGLDGGSAQWQINKGSRGFLYAPTDFEDQQNFEGLMNL